jgi:hypothetical protein
MSKYIQKFEGKKISTIKDFRFRLHILPNLKSEHCTFQLFEYISRQTMKTMFVFKCWSSCGTVAAMVFLWPESYRFYSFVNWPIPTVVGKKCNPIYLLNSSKVKQIWINRNYYDLYVLNVKNTRFSNKNLVITSCVLIAWSKVSKMITDKRCVYYFIISFLFCSFLKRGVYWFHHVRPSVDKYYVVR